MNRARWVNLPSDGPRKPQLAIEIEGREVRVLIACTTHYAAIKLYEDLVASGQNEGHITLELDIKQ